MSTGRVLCRASAIPTARVLILGLAPGLTVQSHRPAVHRRRLGQVHVSHPVQGRIRVAAQRRHRDDGLKLIDCYITAAVRCAPPDNKPLPSELANCSEYLDREMAILRNVKVVVALGKIAFDAYLAHLKRAGCSSTKTAAWCSAMPSDTPCPTA